MVKAVDRFPVAVPRHTFTQRSVARAGELWRCFEEAALQASASHGWPIERFEALSTGCLVRSMRVIHHHEVRQGVEMSARTWVSRFRRQMLITREVHLETAQQTLASATQEWVHMHRDKGPMRADAGLVADFPLHSEEASVVLPQLTPERGAPFFFRFVCWNVWMDLMGHVNHAGYVDFCDESTSRALVARGLDPIALTPVAEEMTFRNGIAAGEDVTVESTVVGRTDLGQVAIAHKISKGDGILCAEGITIRSLSGCENGVLFEALVGGQGE